MDGDGRGRQRETQTQAETQLKSEITSRRDTANLAKLDYLINFMG